MPYHRCPACGLTGYSPAAWSHPRACPNCSAALAPDSELRLVPGAAHDVSRRLSARPEAAAQARHTVAALDVPRDTREALALVVSELVSNAVLHAGLSPADAVDLHISTSDGRVRIEVHDRGRGFDPYALDGPSDPPTPGNQGLVIVAALAAAWGVELDRDGCTVWCEVISQQGASRAPQETLCARPLHR